MFKLWCKMGLIICNLDNMAFSGWMNKVHLKSPEGQLLKKIGFPYPSVTFEGRIAPATIREASDAQILAFLLTLA